MSENTTDINKDELKEEEFERVQVKGCQFGMKVRNGVHLPNGCMNLSSIKNFKLSSQDIIVASYPKSGTTWTQEIVWLLVNDLNFEKAKSSPLFERYVWFDPGLTPRQTESEPPRLIKNHMALQFLPDDLVESKAKIIYVIRNPKDTLVSNFHFYKKVKRDRFVGTFDEAMENFLEGKFWYGSWWEHIDTFTQLPNVLIIHYEDLIVKPTESIEKIANYLDKTLTQSQIDQIIEFTRFENFKEKEEPILLKTSKDYFDQDMSFFRKGVTGDWANHFSEESAKLFDEEINKRLKHFKIDKDGRVVRVKQED